PHVDVLFLGMFDLSTSYGHPGDFRHPDVAAAVEAALAAAKRHGKVAGMYVPDAQAAAPWVAKGMRFFETASEIGLIAAGPRQTVQGLRKLGALGRPGGMNVALLNLFAVLAPSLGAFARNVSRKGAKGRRQDRKEEDLARSSSCPFLPITTPAWSGSISR